MTLVLVVMVATMAHPARSQCTGSSYDLTPDFEFFQWKAGPFLLINKWQAPQTGVITSARIYVLAGGGVGTFNLKSLIQNPANPGIHRLVVWLCVCARRTCVRGTSWSRGRAGEGKKLTHWIVVSINKFAQFFEMHQSPVSVQPCSPRDPRWRLRR